MDYADHLNTPRLVADATGTTVWRWDQQEPFGASPADENPSGLGAFDLPLRLPGQRYDAETALHYNYFRDYDPSIGRYVEGDPIGIAGLLYGADWRPSTAVGLDLYSYATGKPLWLSDAMGLDVAEGPEGPYSKEPESYRDIPRGSPPNQKGSDGAGRYDMCPKSILRKPCKWCVDWACNSLGQGSRAWCCEADRKKCIGGAVDDPVTTGRCNAQYATCTFRGGDKKK